MTKHELIKLFNGMRKGTRAITDIYTDWPTKIFIKYLGYPGHIENSMGIPISPKVVEKMEATYPNIQVYMVSDPPEKVMARLKVHVKAGHKIFVPIIEEDKESFDTEVGTKQKVSWGIKTSYTHETRDEYIDDDGTRMIKINGPDKDGKTIYEGYSDRHLEKQPDAYEKLINGEPEEERRNRAESEMKRAEKHSDSGLRSVSHRPWTESVQEEERRNRGESGEAERRNSAESDGAESEETVRRNSAESDGAESEETVRRNSAESEKEAQRNSLESEGHSVLRSRSPLSIEIPEYLLPARDPAHWMIAPHPHHPGLFIWDEIPQEPPPPKYSMRW